MHDPTITFEDIEAGIEAAEEIAAAEDLDYWLNLGDSEGED